MEHLSGLKTDKDPASGHHEIHGGGRLSKVHGSNEAIFAIIISNEHQKQGLGSELLRGLVSVGHDVKIEKISANMPPDNRDMQHVCKALGFTLNADEAAGIIKADIIL